MTNMMRPYSEVADELARRQANSYTPPAVPQVKQTPVPMTGVLEQSRALYNTYQGYPGKDSK